MKKILVILAALLLMVVLAVPVSAASGRLSVKSTDFSDNEITLELYAEHTSAMIAAEVMVEYDKSVLKLKSIGYGDVFGGPITTSKAIDVNPYMLMFLKLENTEPVDGQIASYTFEILDTAKAGTSEIKFYFDQAVDPDNKEITFEGCSFTLKIDEAVESGEAENEIADVIVGNDSITVPHPDSEVQIQVESQPTSTPDEDEAPDANNENQENSDDDGEDDVDNTTIIVIAIGGVLVAGAAVVIVLILLKKK